MTSSTFDEDKLASAYFAMHSPGAFMGLNRFWTSVKQRFGNEFSYKQVEDFYNSIVGNQTHRQIRRPKLYRHFIFHGLRVSCSFADDETQT